MHFLTHSFFSFSRCSFPAPGSRLVIMSHLSLGDVGVSLVRSVCSTLNQMLLVSCDTALELFPSASAGNGVFTVAFMWHLTIFPPTHFSQSYSVVTV